MSGRRQGVASVVGMLFMVLVFMAAMGAQVYMSSLQAQTAAASAQAQQLSGQRADEVLGFTIVAGGLTATDTGPASSKIVGMILKFENGTSYVLDSVSTPPFSSAALSSGGAAAVKSLVPAGGCSPGAATCLSKYQSVVNGRVSGRGVGLVTSLGNTFWYVPSASPLASDPVYYRTTSSQSTTGSLTAIGGLVFTGPANSGYFVQIAIVYYQATSTPAVTFAISVPSGATFLFCGGMYWANPAQATTDFTPGNLCGNVPNASLGPTTNTQSSCTQIGSNMCEFIGTAYVGFGSTSGPFQMEFSGSSTNMATIVADSSMVVTPAS